MADPPEGTTQDSQAKAVSFVPDVCKTQIGPATVPVPYQVVANFQNAVNVSPNVRFGGKPVFHQGSFIPTVTGDEPGAVGGVKSGTVGGKAEPIEWSKSVRVNSQGAVRHGDRMFMNGQNTIGIANYHLGAAPTCGVGASGKPTADTNPLYKPKTPKGRSFLEKLGDLKSEQKPLWGRTGQILEGEAKDAVNTGPQTVETGIKGFDLETAQDAQTQSSLMRMMGRTQGADELESAGKDLGNSVNQVHVPQAPLTSPDQVLGAKLMAGMQVVAGMAELAVGGAAGLRALLKAGEKEAASKLATAGAKIEGAAANEATTVSESTAAAEKEGSAVAPDRKQLAKELMEPREGRPDGVKISKKPKPYNQRFYRSRAERRKALLRDAEDPNSPLDDKARQYIRDTNGNNVPEGYEVSHDEPLYSGKTYEAKKKLDIADNMETLPTQEHRDLHKECGATFHDFPL